MRATSWCVAILSFVDCHRQELMCLQGFDEYMNIVLDNAVEIHLKTKTTKPIGLRAET